MAKGDYILDVGESAAKRLAILNNAYGPYSQQFLKNIGVKPGMHIADIGCGTGNMTLWFAQEVGSEGQVTGIDYSSEQIDIAKTRSKQAGFNNTKFYALDLLAAATIKEKFDLVYCRFVLAFLQRPIEGLKVMQQLTKPGGVIAVEEIECSSWWGYPPSAAYKQHIDLFIKLGESRGMDFNTGPKLYTYFRQLNCQPLHVSIAVPVFLHPEQKQHMVLVVQECAQAFIEGDLASSTDIQRLIKDLKKLVADDNFLMTGAKVFQVAGKNKH